MADVVQSVFQCASRQGPGGPVGAGVSLVEADVQFLRDQVLQTDLGRPAEQGRGDLRVDQPGWQAKHESLHGFQVLTGAVQQPGSAGCEQCGEQGFQIHARYAVDAGQSVRCRDLDQAQPRVVCLLANELGIQGNHGSVGDGVDQGRQVWRAVDKSL